MRYENIYLHKNSQSNYKYNWEGTYFSISRVCYFTYKTFFVSKIIIPHFLFSFVRGIITFRLVSRFSMHSAFVHFEFCRDSCTFNAFVSCITRFGYSVKFWSKLVPSYLIAGSAFRIVETI